VRVKVAAAALNFLDTLMIGGGYPERPPPPLAPRPAERPLIFIDAGHGGRDPGALGAESRESAVTLAAAQTLKRELERTGTLTFFADGDMLREEPTRDPAVQRPWIPPLPPPPDEPEGDAPSTAAESEDAATE